MAIITGDAGDNILNGGAEDDTLDGQASNDHLDGSTDADTMVGGAGNDTLAGGLGNDTYRVDRGEGQDRISENDGTVGNSDVLLYGATIKPLDMVLSRQVNDLRLAIHGSTDAVTIRIGRVRQPGRRWKRSRRTMVKRS